MWRIVMSRTKVSSGPWALVTRHLMLSNCGCERSRRIV